MVYVILEMLVTAVALMKMANATRTQRLLAGLGVLLLVDIIWVACSEITKVLTHKLSGDSDRLSRKLID